MKHLRTQRGVETKFRPARVRKSTWMWWSPDNIFGVGGGGGETEGGWTTWVEHDTKTIFSCSISLTKRKMWVVVCVCVWGGGEQRWPSRYFIRKPVRNEQDLLIHCIIWQFVCITWGIADWIYDFVTIPSLHSRRNAWSTAQQNPTAPQIATSKMCVQQNNYGKSSFQHIGEFFVAKST